MTKPILLTSREVSQRLDITMRQVQRLAEKGLMPVYAFGPRNVLYFRVSDVDRSPTSLA